MIWKTNTFIRKKYEGNHVEYTNVHEFGYGVSWEEYPKIAYGGSGVGDFSQGKF